MLSGARGIKLFAERQQGWQELGLPLLVCGPAGCEKRMWGNQALPMAYQENENIKFFRSEFQILTAQSNSSVPNIDSELAELDDVVRRELFSQR